MTTPTNGTYSVADALLLRVQDHIVAAGISVPPWRASGEERRRFRDRLCGLLTENPALGVRRADVPRAAEALAGLMTGIGVLTRFLHEPGVEEIIVRNGFVQLEQNGRIVDVGPLAGDEHFHNLALRAADLGGRAIKGDSPFVLVDLPTGDRFTAIVPPLSTQGTALNIRVFSRQGLGLNDLDERGAFRKVKALAVVETGLAAIRHPEIRERVAAVRSDVGQFLAWVTAANAATVLIAGEYSSGKTTLLNALSQYFPPDLQVAVVETFSELRLQHPHAVRAVAPALRQGSPLGPAAAGGQAHRRAAETGVTMADVVNVIYTRMRPDVLVIGEVVAGEAAEFLRAINLGKRAYATIHGDGVLSALYRLESLVEGEGIPHSVVREWIARGIDLVVLMGRAWDGDLSQAHRFVAEVAALNGLDEHGQYRFTSLYRGYEQRQSRAQTLEQMWQSLRD